MSVFHNNALIGAGGGAAAADAAAGPIKSLRFNSGDSAYLSKTFSSAGNRRKWTWAGWVKRCTMDASNHDRWFAVSGTATDTCFFIGFADTDDKLSIQFGYVPNYKLITEAVFRDTAWYHIVLAVDVAQSTASDKVKVYVNGVEQTNFSTDNRSSISDTDWGINKSGLQHEIGKSFTSYLNGYLADVYFIDGSALDPTSFGAFDDNGVWQAAAYSGTFGTNGFHLLDFANESTVGHDSSGNDNDFTANNLSSTAVSYSSGISNASSSYPGTNLFDGNLSTYTEGNSDGTNVTFSGNISGTTIEFYGNKQGSSTFSVNGVDKTSLVPSSVGYFTITGVTSITAFAFNRGGPGNYVDLYAIRVDGVVLVDVAGSDQDVLFDVPTNGTQSDTGAGGEVSGNYCTLNALYHPSTLSNGNLDYVSGAANIATVQQVGTIGVSSGKYYFEVTCTASSGSFTDTWFIGLVKSDFDEGTTVYNQSNNVLYYAENGNKYVNSSGSSYGASYTDDDVIGVAADLTGNTIEFFKNGSSQGSISYTFSGTYLPYISNGDDTSSVSATLNFGQRAFAYSAPSGYKTWNTASLPTPTIADGSAQFESTTYAGDDGTQTISGINHSPDFVWIKVRNETNSHYLFDAVRGADQALFTDLSSAETDYSSTGRMTAFTSDGFTVKYSNSTGTNANNDNYIAWTWNAGANSDKTYTVKVVSDSGNKYRFDDFGTSAVTLDLAEGSTYVFDQSDSSNAGHPIRFGTSANGTDYTTGVTHTGTPGSAGAKTTLVLGTGVSTLYYSCLNHSGMGGQINTNSTAGASNFDGAIQSTVKANPEAGFSVVRFTAGGSYGMRSIGHALNAKPSMVISKRIDSAGDWLVHTDVTGSILQLELNKTDAGAAASSYYSANSSTFSLYHGHYMDNGWEFINYCFTPVAGYSAIGSYTGTGSINTTPNFIYTGFRPRFWMHKRTDSAGSWMMLDAARDPHNVVGNQVYANLSNAEGSGTELDFLSNGVRMRATGSDINGSGVPYIYMCFAENPFQANGGLAR